MSDQEISPSQVSYREYTWAEVESILEANGYTDEQIVAAAETMDMIGYIPDQLNVYQITEVMDSTFGGDHKSFWYLGPEPPTGPSENKEDGDQTEDDKDDEAPQEKPEPSPVKPQEKKVLVEDFEVFESQILTGKNEGVPVVESTPEPVAESVQKTGVTCSRCGKPLSDPDSVAAGMGPVCREHGSGGIAGWSPQSVRDTYHEEFDVSKYVPFPVAVKAINEKGIATNRLVTATGGDRGKYNPICPTFIIRYGERDNRHMRFVHQDALSKFGLWVLEHLHDFRRGIKLGIVGQEDLSAWLHEWSKYPNSIPDDWPFAVEVEEQE